MVTVIFLSCRHKRGLLKDEKWEILFQYNETVYKHAVFTGQKVNLKQCPSIMKSRRNKWLDFFIILITMFQPDWEFTKGCWGFGGCRWQLTLVWMRRVMCWHQRSSKSSLRKPFGFSITWSCNSVPSDFHNHQIISENLNPFSSTDPLEGNQFREISVEVNEPFSSCIVCEKSWRHWQKIPFCFRKDKRKGQSTQILTRNHSSVAEETPTASKHQPHHSQLQAVKAEEGVWTSPRHLVGFTSVWHVFNTKSSSWASYCSFLLWPSTVLLHHPSCLCSALLQPGAPSALPKAWWIRAVAVTWGKEHFVSFFAPHLQYERVIPGILVF